METFCHAYVGAVASACGCKILQWFVDDEHIDVTLGRRGGAGVRGPRVDIQLKATTARCRRQTYVRFPLEMAAYDELRETNTMCPRILVVLLMPSWAQDWTHHTEKRLALRRCAYWASLYGAPAVTNTTSKTIRLPRTQVFDAAGLHAMFGRIEAGGRP